MKKVLWLGLKVDEKAKLSNRIIVHAPIIAIVPYHVDDKSIRDCIEQLDMYTHLIITSKTAAQLFAAALNFYGKDPAYLKHMHTIAVGQASAKMMRSLQMTVNSVAEEETAEGVLVELAAMTLKDAKLLWPHSEGSRDVISATLQNKGIDLVECVLYRTEAHAEFNVQALTEFAEIMFTSSSCVDCFYAKFGASIPSNITLISIGPVTQEKLTTYYFNNPIVRYDGFKHDECNCQQTNSLNN